MESFGRWRSRVGGRRPGEELAGNAAVQVLDRNDRCTLSRSYELARISLSLVGIAGVVAVALAGGIIWLMITQPVMVADSVAKGEYSPLARAIAIRALRRARGLLVL